ncbi:MAG: tyrosine-protein phosphatase [Verrucomicrobiales bacterium]|nr:tyrosine-protein phosphatase [Verrucomicrobiales bacterium]
MTNTFQPAKPPLPTEFRKPLIQGLSLPDEFYWVLPDPALLAGMQLPGLDTPWMSLHSQGFRWVACLCSDRPIYDPSPLEFLVTLELSDLFEASVPDDPEMEEKAIHLIASAVVSKLENMEGVIVHCAGGRGRTGTVIGAVLKKLGYRTSEIITFLDNVHLARNKPGWPESPWQQEVIERTA